MRRNVWIWNHYATNTFFEQGGRHYWLAENLIKQGYYPTIFCASAIHGSDKNILVEDSLYETKSVNNIPYVFINTPNYQGNGKDRIRNMFIFYKNLFPVAKEYAKKYGKPDIILASSVHPLTLVAGIKIAKRFGIQCICEVRDLWPESFVAYKVISKNNPILKLLYAGEKWLYKNADKLIFTMEGGKDYIKDQGWDKENNGPIDLKKVHHINNGVDLEVFDYNKEHNVIFDDDLDDENIFKVVYAGSIRKANNVMKIVEAAECIQKQGSSNIKFLIYGKGDEKEVLEQYCKKNGVKNVMFKAFIEKKYVPNLLSKSDLNILHFQQSSLKKYGASLNKLFEYFASGKPTISDCEFGYDLIKKYNCGFVVDNASPKQLADTIIQISKLPKEEYQMYCNNARLAAQDYDFKVLTERLIDILEDLGVK